MLEANQQKLQKHSYHPIKCIHLLIEFTIPSSMKKESSYGNEKYSRKLPANDIRATREVSD